jgi:hypothetical protein
MLFSEKKLPQKIQKILRAIKERTSGRLKKSCKSARNIF